MSLPPHTVRVLLTASAIALAAPALAASSPEKAPGMPPITGSMYNGNNAHPPQLEDGGAAQPGATRAGQRPNVVNQAVTGTGTGASQGHTSQSGGGN